MRAAYLLCLSTVLSCGAGAGSPSPEPVDPGPPWLEVGAGSTAFEPLADGDAIELVQGPQGGWHVDVAARFGGMSPDGLTLSYRAFDGETGAEVAYPIVSALNEDRVLHGPDGYVRTGDRVVFDIDGPADVVGREVEIRIEARGPGAEADADVLVEIADALP